MFTSILKIGGINAEGCHVYVYEGTVGASEEYLHCMRRMSHMQGAFIPALYIPSQHVFVVLLKATEYLIILLN
jgi:hypothetical protein